MMDESRKGWEEGKGSFSLLWLEGRGTNGGNCTVRQGERKLMDVHSSDLYKTISCLFLCLEQLGGRGGIRGNRAIFLPTLYSHFK